MAKSVFSAMLFILALSGCARTTYIEKEQTPGEYYLYINGECENSYAVLKLQDKEPFRVYNVNVGTDTTSWTDITDGKIKSVKTSDIYSVQVTDRAGGFLSGLAYGFLGGAAAGVAYGNLTDPHNRNGGPYFGLLGGAVVGIVAGPIIGVTVGQPSYFIINEKAK
ncbi:MAG TPA: hypothetical protein VHO03_15100 [Ignavibacteriales bacterium]|nr:hypothetical protein [Ignavibacteriales bacterium]